VKTIRSLQSGTFIVLALMLSSAVLGQETVVHGRVVSITDGDTLKIFLAGQEPLRMRIAFCDAPEKLQAFGTRAKQAMSELAFGKRSSCGSTLLTDTDVPLPKCSWTGKT
jgi:endonuclease YncB( thermonuclease family)